MNWIAASVWLAALVTVGSLSNVRAAAPNAERCVGAATPDETYRAFTEAVNRDDWRTAYQYVSHASRSGLFAELIAGLIVASAFDENKERRDGLDRILRQHGFRIDDKGRYTQGDQDMSEIVRDWPGLMEEISPYLRRWHGKALAPKVGRLRGVQIDGNRATGSAPGTGTPARKITFIQVQSGWCLTTD